MSMMVGQSVLGGGAFVASDMRTMIGVVPLDCGGKVVDTGSGWASGAAARYEYGHAGLKALRDAGPLPPGSDPVARAEAIVARALRSAGLEWRGYDDYPEIPRLNRGYIIVIEPSVEIIALKNGSAKEFYEASAMPRALPEPDQTAHNLAMLEDIRSAGDDLAMRIRAAAHHFALVSQLVNSVSDGIEVGYIDAAGQRGFLRGRSREIADAGRGELLTRFRATPSHLFAPEELDGLSLDGNKGIESQRAATRKGAFGAGTGAQGITGEENTRGGGGGIPVPFKKFHTEPIVDYTGSYPLIDTVTRRFQTELLGPTGIAGDVIERGGSKSDQAIDSGISVVASAIDFVRAFVNKHLGYIPDDGTSDRRAATLNQKTGGDRGYTAIDAGGVAVDAAIDFSRGYTGKHFGNVPDDAISNRRAVTLDEKTGGGRGFSVIDSGLLVVASAVDMARSFLNKHLGNISDDATSDRRAATLNQKTGGDRGYGAIDSGGVVVDGAVDLSRGYTNKHMGYIPDDATSDRRAATANEKTGGSRGFTALDAANKLVTGITGAAKYADGSTGIDSLKPAEAGANVTETRTSADTAAVDGTAAATVKGGAVRANTGLDVSGKLQTGVTPGATAADDEEGIESQRAASRKAARSAGTGAVGITEEEWIRGGCGGSPVPSGRVFTLPVFSADGGTPLLDTATRSIFPDLKYADGVTGIDALKPAEASANRVVGLVSNKITPASSDGRNRVRVSIVTSHVNVATSTTTAVPWNAEAYDVGWNHHTTINPSRLTVPFGGDVEATKFTAQIEWAANATGRREIGIRKNGVATDLAFSRVLGFSEGSKGPVQGVEVTVEAPTVGDYYEVVVWQNSGGDLEVIKENSFFSAMHEW